MKEDMFDVLLYLFENYMSKSNNSNVLPENPGELSDTLEDVGFNSQEIVKAFTWLAGLQELQTQKESLDKLCISKYRIFNAEEYARLDTAGISFILFLEQNGMLDALTRELILDRLIALDTFEISVEQIKWVCLIVLYFLSHKPDVIELMEELVFQDSAQTRH